MELTAPSEALRFDGALLHQPSAFSVHCVIPETREGAQTKCRGEDGQRNWNNARNQSHKNDDIYRALAPLQEDQQRLLHRSS
ncbi:hypothetical protein EYF80_054271 [Liparis tanakae]|uniref:Uncharacterized protein n=1 Tax=Liparis tanakae TaxID=230148 RepID=A0A4Z2F4F0_9TELE|nr:hypothetical protein EYF80_054271 [Liparis tanakae]